MTLKSVIGHLDEAYKDASRMKSLRKFLFTRQFSGISGLFKLIMLGYLLLMTLFIFIVITINNWVINIISIVVYFGVSMLINYSIRNYFEPAAVINTNNISQIQGLISKSHYEKFEESLNLRILNANSNIDTLMEVVSLEIENRKTPNMALYFNTFVVVAIPLVLGGIQETVNKQPRYIVFVLYLFFLGALVFDFVRNFVKFKETRYKEILKYLGRIKVTDKLKDISEKS